MLSWMEKTRGPHPRITQLVADSAAIFIYVGTDVRREPFACSEEDIWETFKLDACRRY